MAIANALRRAPKKKIRISQLFFFFWGVIFQKNHPPQNPFFFFFWGFLGKITPPESLGPTRAESKKNFFLKKKSARVSVSHGEILG